MNDWGWLWHTAAGMIVGFVVALGAWSAAAQAGRSAGSDQPLERRVEPHQ